MAVSDRKSRALDEQGIHYVVADENRERIDELRRQGIPAVAGNAAEPSVLIQAHIVHATMLVIATPDTFHVRRMVEIARALNPEVACVIRSHSESEAALLEKDRVCKVFVGERELARGMTGHIVSTLEARRHAGPPPASARPLEGTTGKK